MNSFAVIFDMDGVIIDSNPFHKISLRQFCEKYGYHLSDEELVKRIYGRTNKEWITNLFGALPLEEITRLEEEKESLFRKLYEKEIQALPGLPDFLKQLNECNIPVAIGTSAPRSNVDYVLRHTNLGKYFSVILDESHVSKGKPNPEIYLKVAAALQFNPMHCVVFEDSLSGVEAAKRAGTKVVGVTTTHTRQELSHTHLIIDDFQSLTPELLFAKVF